MASRYRERAKAALSSTVPAWSSRGIALFSVALSAGFLGARVLGFANGEVGLAIVMFSGMFCVAFSWLFVRGARRPLTGERALFAVDLGEVDAAVEWALATLRARTPGEAQVCAWLVLARCAEMEADFVEADDLLRSAIPIAEPGSFYAKEIAARRAFALAAIGMVAEACALVGLDATTDKNPFRTARKQTERSPLETRAALLCLHRLGDAAAARELFDADGPPSMESLGVRDRALVRRIGAWAGANTPMELGEDHDAVVRWTNGLLATAQRS